MPELPAGVAGALDGVGLGHADVQPLDTGWGPRDGLFLASDGHRRAVVKAVPPGRAWGMLPPSALTRRLAMRAEIETYQALAQRRWPHLRHPRLIATDGHTYLVLQYVEPAGRWPPDLARSVVAPLLDLQLGLPPLLSRRAWRALQALRPRAAWRLLLAATAHGLRDGALATTVRTWRVYVAARTALAWSRSPRLAQHGDLTLGNVVVDADGGIHLLDFQRARRADRLSFRDVVQLAVEPDAEDGFDAATIRAYATRWRAALRRPAREVFWQVRAALLLQVLYILHAYRADRHGFQAPYRRCLEQILLPRKRYEEWFEANIASCGRRT